jgi:trimethylamine--corrinoid protein Co-methyltransferase
MRHFRTAFYRAELFDYNSAEQWTIDGAKDANQRANEKYKQLLQSYQPPPLDPAVDEALLDYIRRRKKEIIPGTNPRLPVA